MIASHDATGEVTVMGFVQSLVGGGQKKGPSAEEIAARQREAEEQALAEEQERQVRQDSQERRRVQNAQKELESKRRAFTSQLQAPGEENVRRTFLKGA